MTAGVRDSRDPLGNKQMQRMLENEPPWWDALRRPENKGWLELFSRSDEFKRWFEDDEERLQRM